MLVLALQSGAFSWLTTHVGGKRAAFAYGRRYGLANFRQTPTRPATHLPPENGARATPRSEC